MLSRRSALAGLVVALSTITAACGASPDATPGSGDPGSTQPPSGIHYDESGNPLPDGELPDPTAGQEGSGDLPNADAGPASDGGAPASDSGAPATDSGGAPTDSGGAPTDSGSTPPPPTPAPGVLGASLVAAE